MNIKTIAVIVLVAGGAFYIGSSGTQISGIDVPDFGFGQDELATDDKIKTTTDRGSFVTKITLYESGAAKIHLKEDHGCFDQIIVSHTDSDETYKTLKAPEFSGPKTINLKQIVENNGPYPNADFEISVSSTEDCMTFGPSPTTTITVPDSWLPDK